MSVEQEGRSALIEVRVDDPNVVSLTMRFEAVAANGFFHDVGCILLITAHRWGGNELFQQLQGITYIFFLCHHNLLYFLISWAKLRKKERIKWKNCHFILFCLRFLLSLHQKSCTRQFESKLSLCSFAFSVQSYL